MLNFELQLGDFFNTASFIGLGLVVPLLIGLIVLLCIKRTRKMLSG